MQGYVTELMITLESVVDTLDSNFKPMDLMKVSQVLNSPKASMGIIFEEVKIGEQKNSLKPSHNEIA